MNKLFDVLATIKSLEKLKKETEKLKEHSQKTIEILSGTYLWYLQNGNVSCAIIIAGEINKINSDVIDFYCTLISRCDMYIQELKDLIIKNSSDEICIENIKRIDGEIEKLLDDQKKALTNKE